MSQFITNTQQFYGSPLSDISYKQVIKSRLKVISPKPLNMSTDQKQTKEIRQQHYFQNMFSKLTNLQYEKVRQQNAHQIDCKIKKIVNKLKKKTKNQTGPKKSNFQSISTIERMLNRQLHYKQDTLSKLLRRQPQIIDVCLKYKKQITNKLQVLRQAEIIQSMKQNSRHFMNKTVNKQTNSPMFRKMNYLLEKIKDEQPAHQSYHNLSTQLNNNWNSLHYNENQFCVRQKKNSEYKKKPAYFSVKRPLRNTYKHFN